MAGRVPVWNKVVINVTYQNWLVWETVGGGEHPTISDQWSATSRTCHFTADRRQPRPRAVDHLLSTDYAIRHVTGDPLLITATFLPHTTTVINQGWSDWKKSINTTKITVQTAGNWFFTSSLHTTSGIKAGLHMDNTVGLQYILCWWIQHIPNDACCRYQEGAYLLAWVS